MLAGEITALDSNVLVLNKHYAAVRVVSARRALTFLVRGVADVVLFENEQYCNYDFASWRALSEHRHIHQRQHHEWVRCVKFELAVPRIVRLLFYDRLPRRPVTFNRRNIFARDRNRCQYCGRRFPTSELSLDHVVPRRQGGETNWTNIVCSCVACNVRKGGRTPEEAGMTLITKPAKPARSPIVTLRLSSEKYASWRQFIDTAYWNVELRD